MMRSVSGFVALGMCQVLEERGFGLICLGWSGSLDDVVHNRWSCLWTMLAVGKKPVIGC